MRYVVDNCLYGVDVNPDEKEREYHRLLEENEDWQAVRRMYDAWCALWFWPVADAPSGLPLVWTWRELLQTIERLRREIRFFHWELEFPDVFEQRSGFDAIVMNPPWERIKLQENEFFATRDLLPGYCDAYAAGDLQVFLGPDEKRTPRRHGMETEP